MRAPLLLDRAANYAPSHGRVRNKYCVYMAKAANCAGLKKEEESPLSFLKSERHGHVLVLTMSSPETRNALTGDEQFDDFEQTCSAVNDDMSVRAVVLTGEGSAFCAGGNVKDMRDRTGLFSGDPFDQADAYRRGIQRIPRAIYALNVPTIAAVNGPCRRRRL